PVAPTPIAPVKRSTKPVTVPVGGVGVVPAPNVSVRAGAPSIHQSTSAPVAPAGQVGGAVKPANATSAVKKPSLSAMVRELNGPLESFRPLICPVAVPPAGMSSGEIVFAAFTTTSSPPMAYGAVASREMVSSPGTATVPVTTLLAAAPRTRD